MGREVVTAYEVEKGSAVVRIEAGVGEETGEDEVAQVF